LTFVTILIKTEKILLIIAVKITTRPKTENRGDIMSAVYQKIIQYIDAHIKEDIAIAEIADTIGYSANHIYKIFKVYSPYPIMEYIRRKKLYFAANEMYSGRKLYDIALDYGYETPAGFYKAFKSIFGCSPSEYKNNIKKEGTHMRIDNVKTIEELEMVLAFTRTLYPEHKGFGTKKNWMPHFNMNPELLLYAKDGEKICAVTLGILDPLPVSKSESGYVTVNEGVLKEYKNTGIFEALFVELEKRVRKLKHAGLVLGITEGEEEFYAKMGYVGKTLVQSEKYSIDALKAFNEQYKNYEITATSVYKYDEGLVKQIWLNVPLMDKELKNKFENEIGDCWVQVIVNKEFL